MTKRFSKELADILAGPPRLSQTDFAKKAKMTKSKMSRLLSNIIACDQPTLQATLNALPSKEDKIRLLNAYLQDVAGAEALSLLTSKVDPYSEMKMDGLSRKGMEKLNKMLHSAHVEDFETMLIALAKSWGL